jgi:mono/diheme cytochrome c family protein
VAFALAVVLHGAALALLVAVVRLIRTGHPLAASAAVLAEVALFFKAVFPGLVLGSGADPLVVPGLAMLLTGRELPLPVPDVAFVAYMALTFVGCLLVMTASDVQLARTVGPIKAFLAGRDQGPVLRPVRLATLYLAIPLLCGWLALDAWTIDRVPPIEGRQAHPSIGIDDTLHNPLREQADEALLQEGRDLFAVHCRPCHGMRADGTGPMARGLKLRPADFTDPGTIATVVEPYSFQRILDGGVGLPANGSPWDSAMPRWSESLDERSIWLALLASYDIAGVEPMTSGEAP